MVTRCPMDAIMALLFVSNNINNGRHMDARSEPGVGETSKGDLPVSTHKRPHHQNLLFDRQL